MGRHEVDMEVIGVFEVPSQGPERRNKTEIMKRAGPQVPRDAADALDSLSQERPRSVERGGNRIITPLGNHPQLEIERGEDLGGFIMQLTPKAVPLLLMLMNHARLQTL